LTKASPTDAVHHNPAITAAAAAIHALINSKPQSPTMGEIAAILAMFAKALPAPDAARDTTGQGVG
jgi:hypothetical protein